MDNAFVLLNVKGLIIESDVSQGKFHTPGEGRRQLRANDGPHRQALKTKGTKRLDVRFTFLSFASLRERYTLIGSKFNL